MEISYQMDGSLWVTQGTTEIEIFEGVANYYKAEYLIKRYESEAIHLDIVEGKESIDSIESELNRIVSMFGGEIVKEYQVWKLELFHTTDNCLIDSKELFYHSTKKKSEIEKNVKEYLQIIGYYGKLYKFKLSKIKD